MNDPDRQVMLPIDTDDDLPLWAYEDFGPAEDPPAAEMAGGLASLGFLKAALKRSARFWFVTALIGMLVGCGLFVKYPPAYQASTSVLLSNNPNVDPVAAMQTNVALVESRPVAQRVVQQLHLQQSVSSFLAASTASVVTDQVLQISVSAPTSVDAVRRAQALAAQFLQFRASLLVNQQRQALATLNAQVTQQAQRVTSLTKQISRLEAETPSSDQKAKLNTLRTQRTNAASTLATLQQTVIGEQASTQMTTASMIQGSQVLNAATLGKHSRLKAAGSYVVGGLIGGLAIGMAIIIVRALVSDRLRRRDDIADAFGAPVRLSVGPVRTSRWSLLRRGRVSAAADHATQRVVSHLRKAVPKGSPGMAGLAVVAVDDASYVARPITSLAASLARDGKRVVLADLSAGASAARLLGVTATGASNVTLDGAGFTVLVPEPDDIAPVGPLHLTADQSTITGDQVIADPVTAACASADLVLTMITLDPAVGGDHLVTWAADAVAVVTAGRSSATRIHAVAEMIRLAGTRLASVVLIGADKNDESLGSVPMSDLSVPASRGMGAMG